MTAVRTFSGVNRFGALALVGTISAIILGLWIQTANAKAPINTLGTPGMAIKGYDAVAYFTQGAPRKGYAKYTLRHKGINWRFSSSENLAKFKANPAKYEPAYGGYCAYGVSRGYLVKIEPDAWSIVSGKLYLNYDRRVRRLWNKRQQTYIESANAKFRNLIN